MPPKRQDVVAIVRSLCEQRARQRLIALKYREITVKTVKGDYRVNRHEIFIDYNYATRCRNPVDMIDRVLDAVVEFEKRDEEEKARRIVGVQVSVMRWTAYLERATPRKAYREFIRSLLPRPPGPGPVYSIATLAPDDDNLELQALIFESETLVQQGMHHSV